MNSYSAIGSKIVHVLMGSGRGGIEVLIPRLIDAMSSYSMEVYVIHGIVKGGDCVFANTNIFVTKGSSGRISAIIDLYSYARKNRHAIFHGYNLGPINLLTLWLAGVKKVVYAIHGTKYWKTNMQRKLVRCVWALALLKEPVIVSNSLYSAQVFRDKIKRAVKITTIYNPLEVAYDRLKPELSSTKPDNELSIIYVGRFVHGKNLDIWLEVAQYISSIYPHARYRLYGQGPLREQLESYAIELGISDKVTFMGFLNEVETAYIKADLTLFLSQYESFGNVVVESVIMGTPVLCSDIPSMHEIFADYPEFIVSLNADLKEAIVEKIGQLDHLKALAVKAGSEFKSRFSMDHHIWALQRIYSGFSD